MNINIIKKQIKYNYSKREGAIKYIVIHDTGNTSKGAGALSHFNYFNGGDRQSSANYFVDSSNIIETVEPRKYRSWSCGDGKGLYGITNDNSIGVEICIASDDNYDKAVKNTIELVKYLMKEFKIPLSNVVRHYDASKKSCPNTLIKGHKGWNWDKFKNALKEDKKEEVLYRVVVGTYANYENAKRKCDEVGGFIIEYRK